MTVGERIAQKRKENNLSMEALGEKLGVGRSAVNKWEKGKVERIKRETILQMAKIFDCDPAWLGGYSTDDEVVIYPPGKTDSLRVYTPKLQGFYVNNEEQQIIEAYRLKDETTKANIRLLLGVNANEVERIKDIG